MNEDSLIISRNYIPVLNTALGFYLNYLTEGFKKDESMSADDISDFMEVYTTAGNLWATSLRASGISDETIAVLLAGVDPSLGSDD